MPEAPRPVAVAAQQVDLLYALPAAPHRELARLHARHVAALREKAAGLGADALVLLEAREEEIRAVAIEYLPTKAR
jgi:hypothetical protein